MKYIDIREILDGESCSVCGSEYSKLEHVWRNFFVDFQGVLVCRTCFEELVLTAFTEDDLSNLSFEKNERTPKPIKQGYVKQPIPRQLRWDVFKRDDFRCRHCGTRDGLSVDHVIPESLGGQTAFDNLQTLCIQCNRRKGTKMPNEL